jgi:hypothetical protein
MRKSRKDVAPTCTRRGSHKSYLFRFLPFKPLRRSRHAGL